MLNQVHYTNMSEFVMLQGVCHPCDMSEDCFSNTESVKLVCDACSLNNDEPYYVSHKHRKQHLRSKSHQKYIKIWKEKEKEYDEYLTDQLLEEKEDEIALLKSKLETVETVAGDNWKRYEVASDELERMRSKNQLFQTVIKEKDDEIALLKSNNEDLQQELHRWEIGKYVIKCQSTHTINEFIDECDIVDFVEDNGKLVAPTEFETVYYHYVSWCEKNGYDKPERKNRIKIKEQFVQWQKHSKYGYYVGKMRERCLHGSEMKPRFNLVPP